MNDLVAKAVAGQDEKTYPSAVEMQNPAAQIALASEQAIQNIYNKAGVPAVGIHGNDVMAATIDSTSVQSTENPFIQFDIVNSGATDETVVIGSVLGQAGASPFFGANPSAADSATVADQFGAGIRAVQGFGLFSNLTPTIVNGLQMISTDSTQRAQAFTYNSIAYDTTQCTIINNTTATFTRFDNNDSVIKLSGFWSIGPMQNISVVSKAGKDMTLIVYLAASASVRQYRGMNG